MSIQVLGMDAAPFDQNSESAAGDRFIRQYVRAVLSGNYVAGGDSLDLTNGGGTPAAPSIVPPAANRGLVSVDVRPIGKTTAAFSCVGGAYSVISPGAVLPVPVSAVNALKLKLFLVTNAEYAAGAYGADALGDLIILELTWAR
jgi:hypothetical protein